MERTQYGVNNSRIWYLCSLPADKHDVTLDNWTRYSSQFRDVYYLNSKILFLEVDHFNKQFKIIPNIIRSNNENDFRNYFKNYMNYTETL